MNRFRPNIVLNGEQGAWAEDKWGKRNIRVQVQQGDAVDLELCKPCSRCTVSSPFTWPVHTCVFQLSHGSCAYMPLQKVFVYLDILTYVHTACGLDSTPCTGYFASLGQTAMSSSCTVASDAVGVCM